MRARREDDRAPIRVIVRRWVVGAQQSAQTDQTRPVAADHLCVIPSSEVLDAPRRLAALERLGIMDSAPEERFDRITRLASALVGTPIALVSLVDDKRQWFKSAVGLDAPETPREFAFCAHAIASQRDEAFVVADALLDDRFADNPLVTGEPGVRFYAGQVVHDPQGEPVGTLCVIDRRPRTLDEGQRRALVDLALMVEEELARTSQNDLIVRLDESERRKSLILGTLAEGLVLQDADGKIESWNPAAERVLGLTADELSGRTSTDPRWATVHADGSPWPGSTHPAMEVLAGGQPIHDVIMGIDRPHSGRIWLRVNSEPIVDLDGVPVGVVTAFTDITAERTATEASFALSERLRAAIENSAIGAALTDVGGRLTYANEAFARLVRRSTDDLLGRPVESIFANGAEPLERRAGPGTAGTASTATTASTTSTASSIETTLLGSGEATWIRIHRSRLDSTAGSGHLLQVEDVTEQRMLAAALAKSEDHARSALDALEQGVVLADVTGAVHRINPAAERLLGYTADELSELWRSGTWETYDEHGMVLANEERPIFRARTTGVPVIGAVVRWRCADGRLITLRVSCIPDADQNGGFVVAFFDVTEQRRAQRDIARFSHLFRHANDIITVIDATGHVLYASPSNERVLGYPEGYQSRRGILDVVHPDDLEATANELQALIENRREDVPFSLRVRSYSGEWRHIECVGVNLLEEPDVGGVVITSRDTTERERLTELLARQAEHDELTGLPNRRYLQAHLTQALARRDDGPRRIGLCFIDLDRFKAVNDTHGHAAGDRLLVNVSARIRRLIRLSDTVARVGGDEFVVLIDPLGDVAEAEALAERIRRALDDPAPFGTDVGFGASVGLAVSVPGDTPSTLLNRADRGLYAAKHARSTGVR